MKALTKMSACLAGGAFGAFVKSLFIWGMGSLGITMALGARISPRLTAPWLYQQLMWGALWALIFLFIKISGRLSWKWVLFWGFVVGLAPTLAQLLYFYPADGYKYFGLKLGYTTPFFVLFFNTIWGWCAAIWMYAAVNESRLVIKEQLEREKVASRGMEPPAGAFCQSCGMRLGAPETFGTNADGSKSRLYCQSCYKDGNFTEPQITMEQMVDKVADIMAKKMDMPEAQAMEAAKSFVPKLKRWRSSGE